MDMKFSKWQPNAEIGNKSYDIESITNDYNGLKITLVDEENVKIIIEWEGVIESWCCSREEARFKFIASEWQQIRKKYSNWSFFKVDESPYINWVYEEGGGFEEKESYIHFMIVTLNHVIDVISMSEPDSCKVMKEYKKY